MDATVVVTGAVGGLGEAAVRAFGAAGADVVAGDRDRDAQEAVVEDTRSADASVVAARADARDEFDLERLMETAARTAARTGDGAPGIDVVVPCATVHHGEPGRTPLSGESYSAFDDTLRTNARGVFGAAREALPHLAADGRVVVPTGSAARDAPSGHGAHPVALAAVEALVRGFAADLDHPVGGIEVGTGPALVEDGDAADAADLLVWAAGLPAERLDGEVLSPADREADRPADG